jgi:hypothetical protein
MFVWSWQLIGKWNRKVLWINILDIAYNTEQWETVVHTKPKQSNTVPFFQGYVLVNSFHDLHWWLCDEHNQIRFSWGVGTTYDMDHIQVSSVKGYFHYNRSNINMSVDRKIKLRFHVESRDSVVSIATGYGLVNWESGVRVPVGSRIFSSPCHPDRLWGPPSLLPNGYRGLFPRE